MEPLSNSIRVQKSSNESDVKEFSEQKIEFKILRMQNLTLRTVVLSRHYIAIFPSLK